MNIDKVVSNLEKLSVLRIQGMNLSLGELQEDRPRLSLLDSLSGEKIDFVKFVTARWFPADWLIYVPMREVAFESLSKDTVEAVRGALEMKICDSNWSLSLYANTDDLGEQGIASIQRLADFETVQVRVRLVVPALNFFDSISVQKLPLSRILPSHRLQSLFTQCRS